MSRIVEVPHLPCGYALGHGFCGEPIPIRRSGILTSEDGEQLYRQLEGVSEAYAAAFGPGGVSPSQVDHILAVIRPDRQATLYCNELQLIAGIRINRVSRDGIRTGEAIFGNDVADVDSLELRDASGNPVVIPDDHGFCLVLSHRWRKALIFDYSVFPPNPRRRTESLTRVFGHAMAQLMFQEMYSVSEAQWARLFEWGWFPFVGLTHLHRRSLLSWANDERYPAPLMEEICFAFAANLEDRVEVWRQRHELMVPQTGFLTTALERFRANDNVGCISVLYPRIEGVMRTLFAEENSKPRPDQNEMVTNLVENQHPDSLLLPHRFGEYLNAVYFQGFDLSKGNLPLSRHSHAHGVSQAGDYDFIRAVVGFMIFDQLCHYLTD